MKTKFEYLILLLLGCFISVMLLYNRFYERISQNIITQSHIKFLMYLSLTITFFILFFKTLYNYKKNLENQNNLFQFILQHPYNPLKIISHSLITTDIFIKNNIPYYDNHFSYFDTILLKISKWLYKYKKYTLYVLYILKTFIEVFICSLFIFDVYYLNKFFYFYKFLWMLIIPMLISYLFYSIKLMVETNLKSLEEVLTLRVLYIKDVSQEIVPERYPNITIAQWQVLLKSDIKDQIICYNSLKLSFAKTLSPEDYEATLKYCVMFLDTAFDLSDLIDDYEKICKKYDVFLNLCKYLAYFCGWSYILYVNIF